MSVFTRKAALALIKDAFTHASNDVGGYSCEFNEAKTAILGVESTRDGYRWWVMTVNNVELGEGVTRGRRPAANAIAAVCMQVS